MSRIPYYVREVKKYELKDVDTFALELSNVTVDMAYDLKQIVPICDDGGTSELYAIYAMNPNLVYTNLLIDEDTGDAKYLTVDQINLIKTLGVIEVNGEDREVKKVTISWQDDTYDISATIELKDGLEE